MYWTPPVIWAVTGLALLALEALVPGLVIMFFGLGALATSLAVLLFDLETSHQFILFAVASAVFLIGLRGWFRKLFQGRARADEAQVAGIESLTGLQAVVTEPIPKNGTGRIKLRGTYYAASADSPLEAGDSVRVVDDPHGDHSVLKVDKL
ncbi:MAG: NfeD family protein [Thermodesulfobacteriota bacterium]